MRVRTERTLSRFEATESGGLGHPMGTGLCRLLSTEVAGGFSGVWIGLTMRDGAESDASFADAEDFVYAPEGD